MNTWNCGARNLLSHIADHKTFDLAVIGAGPAGSLTAALAAEAGLSTVILEKERMPREKPCGGFISSRALSLLPRDFDLPPEMCTPVKSFAIIVRGKKYSYTADNPLGVITKRKYFDHLLARYACRKGALLLENAPLKNLEKNTENNRQNFSYSLKTGESSGETIKSRFLVGADGATGTTAVLGGLRNNQEQFTGLGVVNSCKPDTQLNSPGSLQFYPLPFLGGMGWSFYGKNEVNRGIGGVAGFKLLTKAYRQIFAEMPDYTTLQSWPLPFLGPLKKAGTGNLILVGDAAGLVDPYSGEGLYNAFKSAKLAISTLLEAEKKQTPLELIYTGNFRERFKNNFTRSLAGAVFLHSRSIVYPASLPEKVACIMKSGF